MKYTKLTIAVALAVVISGCSMKTTTSLFKNDTEKERMLLLANNYHELINVYKSKLKEKEDPADRLKLSQLYFDVEDFSSSNYYLEPLLSDDYKMPKKSTKNKTESEYKQSQAFLLKARVLEALKDYRGSIEYADKAIASDPKMAESYNSKGIVLALQGDYENAHSNLMKAKDLYMDDYIINTNLGTINLMNKDYINAINYYEPLYLRGYTKTKFLNNYVFALVKAGREGDARTILVREGITKYPDKLIKSIRKAELAQPKLSLIDQPKNEEIKSVDGKSSINKAE